MACWRKQAWGFWLVGFFLITLSYVHCYAAPTQREVICMALLSEESSPFRQRLADANQNLIPQLDAYNRILQKKRYLSYEMAVQTTQAESVRKNPLSRILRLKSPERRRLKELQEKIERNSRVLKRAEPALDENKKEMVETVKDWLKNEIQEYRQLHWDTKHVGYLAEKVAGLSSELEQKHRHAVYALEKMNTSIRPIHQFALETQQKIRQAQFSFVSLVERTEDVEPVKMEVADVIKYEMDVLAAIDSLNEELMNGPGSEAAGEAYGLVRSVAIALKFLHQQSEELAEILSLSLEDLSRRQEKFLCTALEVCADQGI